MPRPPFALWVLVIAAGLGVLYADLRAEWQQAELDEVSALRARITAAERQIRERCFLSRTPSVVAETQR